jgi:steroid 5-alpha reductase family enzyme
MNLTDFYPLLLWAMFILALVVSLVLFTITAPYGRFARQGWGPSVNHRVGWLVMEAPASLLVAYIMLFQLELDIVMLVFLLIWQVHYFHRAFIYPFTLRGKKSIPIVIVFMAIVFNSANAILVGYHFVLYGQQYNLHWLLSPYFLVGLSLYVAGFIITKKSDKLLRGLRHADQSGYKIPYGFLYEYVSCPNYMGEIIQWAGWALLTLSPAGLVFLIWTLANLVPRALAHHRWYRETFPDYPEERRALVPRLL